MFYRVPFLCADGVATDDGRIFTTITHRTLPLPLAFQDDTQHAGLPTSSVVGQIVAITKDGAGTNSAIIEVDPRDDNGRAIHDEGARACQMIEKGGQGISIDGLLPIDATIAEECVSEDEDGWCLRAIVTFSEVVIGGSTLTPIPAYNQAIVDPRPCDAQGNYLDEQADEVPLGLVASAAGTAVPHLVASSGMTLTAGAAVELSEWTLRPEHFERPTLTPEANYINIEADGRIWGWIAAAERCHQGLPGQCVLAANESTDLSDFLRNAIPIGDQRVHVGFLTMGREEAPRGHQPYDQPAALSPEHYDDAACIAAIVTAGIVPDGEYSERSVWFSGSMRPTLNPWEQAVLAAAQASGDWRGDPGDRTRTLRAALVVPVPGFLRKREPVTASGSCGCSSVYTMSVVSPDGADSALVASGCSCGKSTGADGTVTLAFPAGLTPNDVAEVRVLLDERAAARLAELDAAMPDPLEALDAAMEMS